MTRTCSTLPSRVTFAPGTDATIEEHEALSVASLLSLTAVVRDTGAPRSLLYARIDWAKLQGVPAMPLGAPSPRLARETYTRQARRAQRQRQLERRGGNAGFFRALASR